VEIIRARDDDRGVILIALLWVLTILSVIALSFSQETFVEVGAARNSRNLADAYYIARAGIAATIYQLYEKSYLTQLTPADALSQQPDDIDLGKVTGKFGDGEYEVDVQDESGKINVNMVGEDQLKALVAVVGIPEPDADIIVDSILDWRDADNIPRQNGAEDDYYQSLQPPYVAKNGPLSTVEELLLVRGVTPDYYYGHREKTTDGQIVEQYGLSRYLTVYSNSNRINVNYAPLQVLLSIPGMPEDTAQRIYERRLVKPFQTIEDLNREVTSGLNPSITAMLMTQRGTVYTLTASAHRDNSKAIRVIRAVISLDLREVNKYRCIYWNENIPDR
jgi:general secretion pathway protein K